jgi:multiple antibiotic resistance protein
MHGTTELHADAGGQLRPGQDLCHPAGYHDPVGVVPVFLVMTDRFEPRQRHRAAWQAVLMATLIIGIFALFGQQILLYLGIRLPSLEAAGGLLLLVVASICYAARSRGCPGKGRSTLPSCRWGRLLAGLGAIAAIMVFMREASTAAERFGVALGLAGVLVVLWLTLRFTGVVGRLLDQSGIELVTRISGLLLTAIAVQLVADAIREFIEKASDVPSGFGRRLPGALARSPPA